MPNPLIGELHFYNKFKKKIVEKYKFGRGGLSMPYPAYVVTFVEDVLKNISV